MDAKQIIQKAIESAGDLAWKVDAGHGEDIGILRLPDHPPYLRHIQWRKKPRSKTKMIVLVEVFIVPQDARENLRLVTSHEMEVEHASA
jgi:hypothetical protein